MTDKLSNEERAAIGHWAVIITNRVNELDQKVAEIESAMEEISYNMDVATFILKTFMESKGVKQAGDT